MTNKNAHKHTEWNAPLTKADFYLYQLQKCIDIYGAFCWILFVLGIVMGGKAIYNFFSVAEYYGFDKLFYSVLCFLMGRGALKKYGEFRNEQRRIQNEVVEDAES